MKLRLEHHVKMEAVQRFVYWVISYISGGGVSVQILCCRVIGQMTAR